ncbi:MAG TPA: VanW family protein [Desulfosporosinus sp.]|nr:VanW family protein [Desulfosporosinus sp.]
MALAEQPPTGKKTQKNVFVRFLTSKVTLSFIISLVLILGSSFTALAMYTRDNGLFMPGVTVTGINVGNMTQASAQAKIDSKIQSIRSHVVKFNLDGKTLKSSLGDFGLTLTANEAMTQAYAIGRKGNLIKKAEQKRAALQGIYFDLSSTWDEKKLSEALTQMLEPYQVPAHDASFTITPANTMEISKEIVGKRVDVAALAAQVQKLDISQPENEFKVSSQNTPPKLTAATLEKEKITGLLAGYTTNFNSSQTQRTENVRLAANALDGAVIAPGETFSFNKTLGERTMEKGYVDAYIIVDGKFVKGLAGGICQDSSTLYNTVLLAGLHITQRTNHDLAISYVPLGQDATVAWPSLDLKFLNDSGAYILVRAIMGKNSLTINFYGQPQPGRKVVITNSSTPVPPPEQKVTNNSLPSGQQQVKQAGVQGYKVTSTRTILLNGKTVKTEALDSSYYVPTPRIIAVGPAK